MTVKLLYTDDGKWVYKKHSRKTNPIIKNTNIEYLNLLSPIFEAAKSKSEFEFIFTLLRVTSAQSPGWDVYDTTEDVFWKVGQLLDTIKSVSSNRYLSLWLYGHIIEASEPYQILANLLRVASGERYLVNNFPDERRGRYTQPQSPGKKIVSILKIAKKLGMEKNINPLVDIYNRELRNAIFHSDYTFYNNEFRIPSSKSVIQLSEYSVTVNKAFSYFIAFSTLVKAFISDYDTPTEVVPHPEFATSPDDLFITMVRKEEGLIGLTDVWLPEHVKMKKVEHLIGRFEKVESDTHRRDPTIISFPRSKRDVINKRLKYVPQFLRPKVVKYFQNRI